jgi:hypothetical protein
LFVKAAKKKKNYWCMARHEAMRPEPGKAQPKYAGQKRASATSAQHYIPKSQNRAVSGQRTGMDMIVSFFSSS